MSEGKASAADETLGGLAVRDLAVERGGRRVLRAITFDLKPGDMLAVTGANGAGKSTLLRAIAGLVTTDAGTIAGLPATADIVENLHYLGPQDALKGTLSVAENLAFWQAMLGTGAPVPPLDAVLGRLGLAALAGLPAAYLSAGQRRRLALARLVAAPRPLWLLDEPTNALDTAGQALLDALIGEHLAAGGMALVATHVPLPRATQRLRLGLVAAAA